MSKDRFGEYQYIIWDGDAPYEIIRGHVNDDDAIDIIEREGIVSEGVEWPTISHDWARWVPDATGEYDMRFELARGRGRGAFPVTLLYYE